MDPSGVSDINKDVDPVDPNSPLVIEVNVDDSPPASPRRRRNAEASERRSALRRFFDFRHATWPQISRRVVSLNGILILLLFAGYGLYQLILYLKNHFKKN